MGFPKELFLNHVDDEFTCSICLNVLEDPVQDNEEHTFCRACITEWLNMPNRTCPISRNYLNCDQLHKPFRIVMNLLSKMEMKCSNESKGCKEVFKLEDYNNHMKVCAYDPCKYFNCNKCSLSLPLKFSLSDKEHNCFESLKEKVTEMKKLLEERNKQILGLEINLNRSEELARIFKRKLEHQNVETSSLKEKLAKIESKSYDESNKLDSSFKKKSKLPRLFSNAVSRHTSNNQTFIYKKKWNPSTLVSE